nr:DUF2500 family protein [Oceanirhabdus seepicola]
MNRDNLIFFSIFSFIICIFVSYIILIFITPVTEVNAKLKSKKCDSKINVSLKGGGAYRVNTYKLTFELDNGDEMSFPVYDKHYVTILEGNKGIMKYKKGLVNRYVGFYVKEVE